MLRLPASHSIEPFSKQVTIVIGLTVVGFMAFWLTLSFYRNILFDRTLEQIRAENERIAREIKQSEGDVEYLRSDQYKDKYAKENLGKITPGEKVLLITMEADTARDAVMDPAKEQERREAAYQELLRQMPIQDQWRLYLFHPEELERLQVGL